ncbi:MAG: hypothetical protein ACE5FT_02460 [Candidatus Nanoarchaeia archaeon]
MEEYSKLRQKHHLPSFGEMDKLFNISTLDEFTLKEVLKTMESKIEYLSSVLEEILQPSPESLTHINECRHFKQDEKGDIYILFKKLQFHLRAIVEANIIHEPESYANVINTIFRDWPELKQQALPFVKKLKESWNVTDELREHVEYFG